MSAQDQCQANKQEEILKAKAVTDAADTDRLTMC